MTPLKTLYLTIVELIAAHPEVKTEALESAITAAKDFLESSKSFEYCGEIKLDLTTVIKLVDMKTDLDDVIRAIAGKRTGISRLGELTLVLVDEITPEQKAA